MIGIHHLVAIEPDVGSHKYQEQRDHRLEHSGFEFAEALDIVPIKLATQAESRNIVTELPDASGTVIHGRTRESHDLQDAEHAVVEGQLKEVEA